MANIASQKKRILRSERERTENRLLTSTVKTHFRRLEGAVEAGDADQIASEHTAARLPHRQGRAERRAAQEHRRPQEVPRRAAPPSPSSVRVARVQSTPARVLLCGAAADASVSASSSP